MFFIEKEVFFIEKETFCIEKEAFCIEKEAIFIEKDAFSGQTKCIKAKNDKNKISKNFIGKMIPHIGCKCDKFRRSIP